MRGFQCHYYHLQNDDTLIANDNSACFAGVREYHSASKRENLKEKNVIYIDQFTHLKTSKYIKLLVGIINEITPCKVVTIKKKKYIKFQLLATYDQSLVLLNFIRNLWYNPVQMYGKEEGVYYKEFFRELETSKEEDALAKLTSANKEACRIAKLGSSGHCNCHSYNLLKIKKTKELLEYKGVSTSQFLQDLKY